MSKNQDNEKARVPKELLPVAEELKALAGQIEQDSMARHRAMGRLLRPKLDEYEKQCGRKYGMQLVDKIAAAANINSRTLRDCFRVDQIYSDRDFGRLSRRRMTWGHVRLLATVSDPAQREALEKQIAAAGLSTGDLKAAIKRLRGDRRRGPGRRHKAPTKPSQALAMLSAATTKFCNFTSQAVFGEAFDLPSALATLRREDLTQQLRDEAAGAAEQLEQLIAEVGMGAKRLREAVASLDQLLADESDDELAEEEVDADAADDGPVEDDDEPKEESQPGPYDDIEFEEGDDGEV